MAQRLLDAFSQYFSNGGEVLTDGQLRFCVSGGSTSDLLDTFSDINLDNPNTNPLPLEAGGRVPDCFGYDQYYKIRLEFTDGTLIQEFDPVGGPASAGEFGPWNNEKVYSKSQIVTSGNRYWRSVDNGNQGHEPSTTSDWAEIKFIEQYLAGVEYPIHFIVQDAGLIYRGLQAANTGHTPASYPDWWELIGSIPKYSTKVTYAQYERSYIGSVVYVSQQNTNLNHDPLTDTAYTWWKPESRINLEASPQLTQVKYLSGGGNLFAEWDNWLTDSNSYALPAANTVPANGALVVTKPDKYRTSTPTVTLTGGDYLESSAANDFGGIQLLNTRLEVFKFISNGSNGWRIG